MQRASLRSDVYCLMLYFFPRPLKRDHDVKPDPEPDPEQDHDHQYLQWFWRPLSDISLRYSIYVEPSSSISTKLRLNVTWLYLSKNNHHHDFSIWQAFKAATLSNDRRNMNRVLTSYMEQNTGWWPALMSSPQFYWSGRSSWKQKAAAQERGWLRSAGG